MIAGIAFFFFNTTRDLIRETQCSGIRSEWQIAQGLVPPDHVVVSVNGQVQSDQYRYRDIAPQPQRIADAEARYQQNGCTGSINPGAHANG